MTVLFPPVLESLGPAFEFKGGSSAAIGGEEFTIRFSMPSMVPANEIKHVQVSIKYASTGDHAVNPACSPDGQVLYISAQSRYFVKENNFGNYTIKIPYKCFKNGFPARNTMFLVQVRFGLNNLWLNGIDGIEENVDKTKFAQWRQMSMLEVPSLFGEWSNISKRYCFERAATSLTYDYSNFMPKIIWTYSTVGDDPIEQIMVNYSYMGLNEITIRKSEVFSGQFNGNNDVALEWTIPLAPVTRIRVVIEAVTKNNAQYHGDNEYIEIPAIAEGRAIYHHGVVEDLKLESAESEDGVLAKRITMPENEQGNKYNVYRVNTLTLDCLKIISNQEILPGEFLTFKDYTVEMGEDYQYVVARPLTKTNKDDPDVVLFNDIYPFGPENPAYGRLMKMDASYLTSRGHQLRLQGNVTLSNFRHNTQDNFQQTIGSKYPFYSRASEMNYRTFTISALISINFDPTSTFMYLDAFGELKIGDKISSDKYFLLMDSSPGCKPYFIQLNEKDSSGFPVFRFDGLPAADKAELEAKGMGWKIKDINDRITSLVNRCCKSLVLNGLWWKDDNGNSQLWIQDRDILETTEFSLSRVRRNTNDWDKYDKKIREGSNLNLRYNATAIYDNYLHKQSGLLSGTTPTDQAVYVERKYREKVMEWLSNGEPKLFRSETEGNMIVMLSGVSFTPYDKSYRMVYSMSATVTEIAEYNGDSLLEYNLIPTYIQSAYINQSEFNYVPGHYDPEIMSSLYYQYRKEFDIPPMMLRAKESDDPMEIFSANTYPAVYNGTPPYTFTYGDFPRGFKVTADGVLTGSPIGTSTIEPGIGWIQVTDANGQRDTIYVPYGYMYLRLTGPSTIQLRTETLKELNGEEVMVVGDKIKEIYLTPMMRGGVQPYIFYGFNLPSGVIVDEKTGEVSGAYRGEITNKDDMADARIEVRDEVGQNWTIKVGFLEGKYALTFVHLPEFDLDYTEVNEDIPWVYLYKGASGGEPFGTQDAPYYKFYSNDLPDGLAISDGTVIYKGNKVPNGVLYGAPTAHTDKAGAFNATCEDAVGTTQTIQIYYNRILEEFRFVWKEEFDIIHGEPSIPIGTDIGEIDLLPAVSGGLPFVTGSPYRFKAIDLLPFRISRGGLITGKATVAMPMHQAYIYAIDARGKQVPIIGSPEVASREGITISEISSKISFDGQYYEIKGLKQGVLLDENSGNVKLYLKDGTSTVMNSIPAGRIKGGQGPYSVYLREAPDGIELRKGHYAIADEDYWYFYGIPTEQTSARKAWLQITDANNESISVQVFFDPIVGVFAWNPFPNTTTAKPNENVTLPLSGITGGVPSYDIYLENSNPDWVMKNFYITGPADKKTLTGWRFIGRMPNTAIPDTTVYLACKDSTGAIVRGIIRISKQNAPVEVYTVDNPLSGKTLIVNIDNIPTTKIIEAFGGTGSFTYGYTFGDLPGGITMNSDGTIGGLVKAKNGVVSNLAQDLFALDGTDPTRHYPVGEVFNCALAVDVPQIAAEIGGTANMLTATYNVEGLLLNQPFRSKDLFSGLYALPGSMVDVKITKGSLGQGLFLRDYGNTAFIEGQVQTLAGATDVEVTMVIKPHYAQEIRKVVKVNFAGTTGRFSIIQDPKISTIPANGVGKPLTPPVPIGTVSGGAGPFNWTAESGLPSSMSITVSTDTRTATITGSYPGAQQGQGTVIIKVTDTANGDSQLVSVPFGGAYPELKSSGKVTIPASKVGTAINKIEVFKLVSGGVQPYRLSDDDNVITARGFTCIPDEGTISGAPTQAALAYTGSIYVYDKVGQRVSIPITIGKIDGPLVFVASAATGPLKVTGTPLRANVAVPSKFLVNLKGGAAGGSLSYKYEVVQEDDLSTKWDLTLQTDGRFSAMKPKKAMPAGRFKVKLSDTSNNSVEIFVEHDEVK